MSKHSLMTKAGNGSRLQDLRNDFQANSLTSSSETILNSCSSVRLYSGKVVVFGQKWLYSGKVIVFVQKWFLFGQSSCIPAK